MDAALVVAFERVRPDESEVLALYDAFIREADGPLGIDLEAEIAMGPPAELVPPNGLLLLARVAGAPAGLGGVRHLDTELAEVKSMFVSPAHRGIGLGRRLLSELEDVARRHGCRAVRLDTSDYLSGAVGLYRSAGYREVPAYNANRKANLWFERSLGDRVADAGMVAGLDLEDEPVRISPYDPRWPDLFAQERAALEGAIAGWATGGIHHVGSTAVPGLDAKPIVDILVGVDDLETSRASFEPLAGLGYLHAPYRSEEMHWFCKPHPSRRTHHLHLVPTQSARFADELAFRDRLRASAETARAYAALKHSLAARFGDDREAYTDAKTDFIDRILAE